MSPTPDLPTKPHEPRLHRTLTIYVCTVKDCPSFFGVDDPDSPDGDHGWDPDGWPSCPTHKRPMRPTRVEEVRERPGDHPAGCFYGSFAEAYPGSPRGQGDTPRPPGHAMRPDPIGREGRMSPTADVSTVAALTPVENAQIQTARSSAASVVAAARDLSIENEEQASRAGEILRDLKTVAKRAEDERLALTKPYRDKVSVLNTQYREPTAMLAEADKTIRAKVKAWTVEQERLRAIEQARLDAEAEAQRKADEAERDRLAAEAKTQADAWEAEEAKRRADAEANPSPEAIAAADAAQAAREAMAALEASRAITPLPVRQVEVAAPVAKPTQGVSTRKTWTFSIEDPGMVPPQWWRIDEGAIREHMRAVVKEGCTPEIPGVRFWRETGMQVRGR